MDKAHILMEFYGLHFTPGSKAVVTVNNLVGNVFLPQVAGVFFGTDSHDRAEQLGFHISSLSGLGIEIVAK